MLGMQAEGCSLVAEQSSVQGSQMEGRPESCFQSELTWLLTQMD